MPIDPKLTRPTEADIANGEWAIFLGPNGVNRGVLRVRVRGVELGKRYILKADIVDVVSGETAHVETPPLETVPSDEPDNG